MYLAKTMVDGEIRFSIRQSYKKDDLYVCQEVLDLGYDPSIYIIYPGGRSFYLHEEVEECLTQQGIQASAEELEDIFWPFVHPDIRRSLECFRRRSKAKHRKRNLNSEEEDFIRERLHSVDKRRYNYLRFGEPDQSLLTKIPNKFYRIFAFKSRDEIEQLFIDLESKLKPNEYSLYVYSFLYLRRFFDEILAGKMPQALDQERLDRLFIQEICQLNQDLSFWGEIKPSFNLHPYLVRYAIMYMDYTFGPSSYMDEQLQDFIARSRERFQKAYIQKKYFNLEEASQFFGISKERLNSMSKKQLTRLYRRSAQKMHPDKGGDNETFIKLNKIYQDLLAKKKKH